MPSESVEERLARVEAKLDGLRELTESGDRAVRQLVTFQTERNDEIKDMVTELRALVSAAHRRLDEALDEHREGTLARRVRQLERNDSAVAGLTNLVERVEASLQQATDPKEPGSLAARTKALEEEAIADRARRRTWTVVAGVVSPVVTGVTVVWLTGGLV